MAVALILNACGATSKAPENTEPVVMPSSNVTNNTNSTQPVTPAPVTPTTPTVPKIVVSSQPANAGHAGVFYATPVIVKILDQNNNPIANVTPVVSFNDNGWVAQPTASTTNTGTVSYSWAPGTSATPTMTITYGSASQTFTGSTTTWVGTLQGIALSLFNSSPDTTGYQKEITPLKEPNGTYYAVLQWNGGYAGIQKGGSRYDRQLQFSLWDIVGATKVSIINSGTSVCSPFGGEGNGTKCENTYPWVVGGTYRFTMTSVAGTGYKDVTAVFTDVNNNTSITLGTLRQYSAPSYNYIVSFVEDFTANSDCFHIADRSATFSIPKYLSGATWATVSGSTSINRWDPTQYCATNQYSKSAAGITLSEGSSYKTESAAASVAVP
jgi:hypothetical protein